MSYECCKVYEFFSNRLYLQNILHKLMENLEDGMEDVVDKLAIDAEDTYEFLQDALKGFIEYTDEVIAQLGGKITGNFEFPLALILFLRVKFYKKW